MHISSIQKNFKGNIHTKIRNFSTIVPSKIIKEKFREINKSLKKRKINIDIKTH